MIIVIPSDSGEINVKYSVNITKVLESYINFDDTCNCGKMFVNRLFYKGSIEELFLIAKKINQGDSIIDNVSIKFIGLDDSNLFNINKAEFQGPLIDLKGDGSILYLKFTLNLTDWDCGWYKVFIDIIDGDKSYKSKDFINVFDRKNPIGF